ncbi:MAG TPA: branched-chain amino acid ABC transporter permease/ATP-binding protein [Acidimicrobiales bacterium]|nr:branched-chain amino acid ABC transporter permease/ATP-binding protein [Acidimicrobiales bacterium]
MTPQLVVDGLVSGLVFGLLAMGIVLVYRATRVINFAVGNMGMVGAGLLALLVVQYGVAFWLAVAVSLVVGTLYGAVVELVVVRRLFTAPRVIVLVATIGVAQLSQAILVAYPDIEAPRSRFPVAVGAAFEVGSVRVTGPQLTVALVVPVVAVLLAWFMNRTTFGRSVKASADNPDLARLAGVSPKRVSLFVWATAGALSTLSLELMAGQTGSAADLASLGQSTLVRALAAAVIAGMVSFPRAFTAGLAVGVAQAAIAFNVPDQPGLVDVLILAAVLVAVYLQSRASEGETRTFSFAPKRRPIPERLRDRWWARQVDRVGLAVLAAVGVTLPIVVTQPSRHLLYTSVLVFALCGLSLTVLTGWAGQLSLGQMAFAGIGALLAAGFTRGIVVDVSVGGTRLVKAGVVPLPFGVSVALASVVTAAIAALIGIGALRVRGLLLAVSTFAFGLAATQYFYRLPILNGDFGQSVPFRRSDLFGLDVRSQRTYYYVVLAVLAVATAVVARLRRTGIGRTTIGVRDNAEGAAAYTTSATRVKLRAFALAGGMAGLGGALLAGSLQTIALDRFFTVDDSLLLVALVVIGGLGSVSGPVLGAIWVVGLPALFPDNPVVPLLTSSMGLLVLLLYFPGGLVQVGYSGRDALLDWWERRLGPAPATRRPDLPTRRVRTDRPAPPPGTPVLATAGITVAFGGIHAVSDVAIRVDPGEIVGLIGTNGAGKSTLMNAIGGYVPSAGRVELAGEDVSARAPHARARRGLGRSFQAATLFPELTVRETVQLALEARHRTGLLSAALALPPTLGVERRRRAEADELIDFLGLGRYADTYVSDLSTGTRRIVELAGLLALDARLLCLDEPTAGLAQRETEASGPLIQEIRRELDASVLVIEHDMPLIMGISDRVYGLDLGRIIAEGPPATVRSDPAVIAGYLGTDERAIARSGARAVVAPVLP